jgi:predicted helicase
MIKWSRDLKKKRVMVDNDSQAIVLCQWRPFVVKYFFVNKVMSDVLTSFHFSYFGNSLDSENRVIAFLCVYSSHPIAVLAIDKAFDSCMLKTGNGGTESVARWKYRGCGPKEDNITDWALQQFRAYYEASPGSPRRSITKDAIFHYVYGILHDPIYREKYAVNLRREFPRIPFYADFWRWAHWGERLMSAHIGYETVEPWPLRRVDTPDERSRKAGLSPKPMLKANKGIGVLQLDSETQLSGVPREAWQYRLGNRSALEWILDQHKEKTPKDPTIREKFNTYRFADHKEKVIEVLKRVTRVSVETVAIVEAMRQLPRS